MLMQNIKAVVLAIVLVLIFASPSLAQLNAWKMVHGEVVQVFPEHHKLLLEIEGQKQIYELSQDCKILRLGSQVALSSLRPITPNSFQDVLCWVDHRGVVSYILVNYSVQEEDGRLVAYDIFGNLK